MRCRNIYHKKYLGSSWRLDKNTEKLFSVQLYLYFKSSSKHLFKITSYRNAHGNSTWQSNRFWSEHQSNNSPGHWSNVADEIPLTAFVSESNHISYFKCKVIIRSKWASTEYHYFQFIFIETDKFWAYVVMFGKVVNNPVDACNMYGFESYLRCLWYVDFRMDVLSCVSHPCLLVSKCWKHF